MASLDPPPEPYRKGVTYNAIQLGLSSPFDPDPETGLGNVNLNSIVVYMNGVRVGSSGLGTIISPAVYSIEDLQPGTTYDFQTAYFGTQLYTPSGGGPVSSRSIRSALSTTRSITTSNLPTEVPSEPIQSLELVEITADSVSFSWDESSENIGGYNIYRLGNQGSEKVAVENAFATTLDIDDGLSFDTEYTYQISAFNTLGESPKSDITFTTLHEARLPAAPSALVLGGVNRSAATIYFQDNADNEDGYLIFESKSEMDSYIIEPGAICEGENLSRCTINRLVPDFEYTLYLQAFTYTERRGYSSQIIRSTGVPLIIRTTE